jgi:hypothetical protein
VLAVETKSEARPGMCSTGLNFSRLVCHVDNY